MDVVKFTETIFSNNKKKGVLTPDSDGYYTVLLGGLNTYNSAGEYYVATGVVEMFQGSSHFMRRVHNGALYSELGHPKRQPGMGLEDFYRRIVTIDENNICAHISEVWLDFNFGKEHPEIGNPEFVAIMGKVKPAGPKASGLELSFQNPKENTAFSIRGLTENHDRNGRTERMLTEVITFDNVPEPGIAAACKAYNPAAEALQIMEATDVYVNKDLLRTTLQGMSRSGAMATESNRALYNQILGSLREQTPASNRLRHW